jgi:hypothetical protein
VIVEVLSADWVWPIRMACEALADWSEIPRAHGVPRTKVPRDLVSDTVAESLAKGGRVLEGLDPPDRNLPSTFRACADLRVRIAAPPANAVIARVIRAATGERVRGLPDR